MTILFCRSAKWKPRDREEKPWISNYFIGKRGGGEPLILLHGNGEDGSYFVHQIEHFQSRYRVIALDTRGHGRSPRGSAPFTIRQFALDLYDFLRAHEIPSAVLLGFSDGANIAMQFALDHPEMVRALILNGGNLDPSGVRRSTQLPIELGYRIAKHFASRSAGARKNAELLGLMVNEPHLTPARPLPPLHAGAGDLRHAGHDQGIALKNDCGQPPAREPDHPPRRPLPCKQAPGSIQPGRRRFSENDLKKPPCRTRALQGGFCHSRVIWILPVSVRDLADAAGRRLRDVDAADAGVGQEHLF